MVLNVTCYFFWDTV